MGKDEYVPIYVKKEIPPNPILYHNARFKTLSNAVELLKVGNKTYYHYDSERAIERLETVNGKKIYPTYQGSYGLGKDIWPLYSCKGFIGEGNSVIVLEGEKCVDVFTKTTGLYSCTLLTAYTSNEFRIEESLKKTEALQDVTKFLYISDNDKPGYDKAVKFNKTLWKLGYESSMIDINNFARYYNISLKEGDDIVEFLVSYRSKGEDNDKIRFLKLLRGYINRDN